MLGFAMHIYTVSEKNRATLFLAQNLKTDYQTQYLVNYCQSNRARQLYKNISMLFLFPVKDGKLSTGVNATFDASCYG